MAKSIIGDYVILNENIKTYSPSDVGSLVEITSTTEFKPYGYKVKTVDGEILNVMENEIEEVPEHLLNTYLEIAKVRNIFYKNINECVVLNINFLNSTALIMSKNNAERFTITLDELQFSTKGV